MISKNITTFTQKPNNVHKAEKYLDKIVTSKDRDSAIEVLRELAADLGIGQSHGKLLHLRERLNLHKESFKALEQSLRENAVPNLEFLQDLRGETIHCYISLCDELNESVNRLKISYGEDRRSSIRSTILTELNADEKFKKEHNAKSISALKEIYSIHSSYAEWLTCSALSYGIWSDFRETLKYINFFIDSLASRIKTEQTVKRMDLK